MYLILTMGANFEAGRIASDANVGKWHNPDLQRPLGLGPITGALPTFGVQCRLLYRGFGQALSGYVMPQSFCMSFCTG